jgi:hypothetical protein
MIGYIFASSLEQLDQFLFFQRWIYHVFEPKKEWAVKRFLSQIDRKLRVEWKKNLDHTFDWNAQEKIVSELLFTRVVNYYLIYIRDIAEHVARRTKLSEGTNLKIDLSNYPKVKRFFREKLEFSLYLTPEEENLAGQIITIRNLIVHNFNYIPDRFLTKFYNWKGGNPPVK